MQPTLDIQSTEDLWQAIYRSDPNIGSLDGDVMKFSGNLIEAAKQAEAYADRNGLILQCIHRRY